MKILKLSKRVQEAYMKFLERIKQKYLPEAASGVSALQAEPLAVVEPTGAQVPLLQDRVELPPSNVQHKIQESHAEPDDDPMADSEGLVSDDESSIANGKDDFLLIGNTLYQLSYLTEGGKSHTYKEMPTCRQYNPVTVKMISPQWLNHAGVKRQLCLETNIVRSLEHPDLPKFAGRGQYGDQLFLAYEHIPGDTLLCWLRNNKLTRMDKAEKLKTVVHIVKEISDQLCYLHTKIMPVVHGDLSAENIIITPDLNITVTDFSSSHLLNTPTAVSYRWVAKPSYLTPEQARGDRWSWQSDLYQLGILLFEMISGCRWNKGTTPREKMIFSASVKKPAEDFLVEQSNQAISSLVAELLEPKPEQRTITAAQCFNQLKEIESLLLNPSGHVVTQELSNEKASVQKVSESQNPGKDTSAQEVSEAEISDQEDLEAENLETKALGSEATEEGTEQETSDTEISEPETLEPEASKQSTPDKPIPERMMP